MKVITWNKCLLPFSNRSAFAAQSGASGQQHSPEKARLMLNHMHPAAWKLSLFAAALLACVAATTARATEASTHAASPVEELVELDEVWVRGKKLSRLISDAEDRLFRLYNKVNKNNIYDVHCGFLSLEPGSMIMTRSCLPGYLSDINYVSTSSRSFAFPTDSCASSFRYGGSGCASGASGFSTGYVSPRTGPSAISLYSAGSARAKASEFDAVPPSVLAAYRREAYAQNVMDVITSDPRLVELATDLARLYREMELVQNRYVKVRQAAGVDAKVQRYRGKFPRHP